MFLIGNYVGEEKIFVMTTYGLLLNSFFGYFIGWLVSCAIRFYQCRVLSNDEFKIFIGTLKFFVIMSPMFVLFFTKVRMIIIFTIFGFIIIITIILNFLYSGNVEKRLRKLLTMNENKDKMTLSKQRIFIPILPDGFNKSAKSFEYKWQEKLSFNLKYFEKYKKVIFQKFNLEGKWFGFWVDGENENVVTRYSMECVSTECPIYSVISFGDMSATQVLIDCEESYFSEFTPGNFVPNDNFKLKRNFGSNHYYVNVKISFLMEDGLYFPDMNVVGVIDNGASSVNCSKIVFDDLEKRILVGKPWKSCGSYKGNILIAGNTTLSIPNVFIKQTKHEKANDRRYILLGNKGFLFTREYYQTFNEHNIPKLKILGKNENLVVKIKTKAKKGKMSSKRSDCIKKIEAEDFF